MKYVTLLPLVLLVVLLPEVVSAQFVPCGGPDQPACQFCHLVEMGNTIVLWLVFVLTIVAGLIFAVAGLKLVTSGGNPSQKDAAKSMFVNVIVGYLIVLAAWLIIDTLMKGLADQSLIGEDGTLGPWNQIECTETQPTPTEIGGGNGGGAASGGTGSSGSEGGEGTHLLTMEVIGGGHINLDGAMRASLGSNYESYPNEGQTVQLEAVANEGYEFVRWEGVSCTGRVCSVTIEEELNVRAVFDASDDLFGS